MNGGEDNVVGAHFFLTNEHSRYSATQAVKMRSVNPFRSGKIYKDNVCGTLMQKKVSCTARMFSVASEVR